MPERSDFESTRVDGARIDGATRIDGAIDGAAPPDGLDGTTRKAQLKADAVEGEIRDGVRELSNSMTRLVKDHLELARMEAREQLGRAVRDVVLTVAALFLFMVGYGLLIFGLTVGLGQAIGIVAGFVIVAALHLVVGAALFLIFARRLAGADRPSLDQTTRELRRDRDFAKGLGDQLREN